MIEFLISLLVNALLITYLFPHIKGFSFTGKFFPHGILYALGLEVMGFLIGLAIVFITLATLGLGLFVIIPCLLLGFWLINAIELKLLARFFPAYLTINGWLPAILAGLCLLVVDAVISGGSLGSVQLNQ